MASVTAVLLLLVVSASYWIMETLPVSRTALDRIQINMPKESVRNILGKPTEVMEFPESEQWQYSHCWKWTMVNIQFNEEGKVYDIAIDR